MQDGHNMGLAYVIAWARGQLSINLTSIFRVFTKLPQSQRYEGNLESFENTSEINLCCKFDVFSGR